MRSSESSHIVVIGDIGSYETYHVGDEAMLDANLTRLRRHIPNVHFTVITRDPEFSKQQYNAHAIKPFGFPQPHQGNDEQRSALLEKLIKIADHKQPGKALADHDPASTLINELSIADGLLISGGGNLSSTWPHHLYERVALIQIAHIFNKPIVVTGQTIGPNLDDTHWRLLQETLSYVELLGVREMPSFRLALELGVPPRKLEYHLDDAIFLNEEAVETNPVPPERPVIAVTIHPFAPLSETAAYASLAEQLEQVARLTGAHLLFIPHLAKADDDSNLSDVVVAQKLISHMHQPNLALTMNVETARKTYWLTHQASMIISSRYHPLVFGIGCAVPGVGIYTDKYTKIKLKGALEHAELQTWILPVQLALNGGLAEAASELWTNRLRISEHIRSFHPFFRHLDENIVSRIANAFQIPVSSDVDIRDHSQMSMSSETVNAKGTWLRIARAFETEAENWEQERANAPASKST